MPSRSCRSSPRNARSTGVLCFAAAMLAVAACSNSGSSGGLSVCPLTVVDLCAQSIPPGTYGNHCVSTLAAAEADSGFCTGSQVTEETCSTGTVITRSGVDTSEHYYYDASGALVAITGSRGDGQERCAAGDGTFAIPHPCLDWRPLPACAGGGDAGG